MNPLSLPPLPPAEPNPAPGGSVRASRAASARPARGRMRSRLRGGQAVLMNPLSLPPQPPAELQPAPGSSVRASRAASARPACGRMRGRLRRRASRAYEPPLPAIAAVGRAPGGSVRASRAASARPTHGRMRRRLQRRAGRTYEPPLPATAAAGSAAAGAWQQREGFTGCQRTRPHAAACEAGCGGGQAGLMNPLFLPSLPSAERLAAA